MKNIFLGIIILFSELTSAQNSQTYFKFSGNAFFINESFPNSKNILTNNYNDGIFSPGYGIGILNNFRLKGKLIMTNELDLEVKKRDRFNFSSAYYFRLPEAYKMTTLKLTNSFEYYLINNVCLNSGFFVEYILDKNQNFSGSKLTYKQFNYGPSLSMAFTTEKWRVQVNYQYGIAKVVDFLKDDLNPTPLEQKPTLQFNALQLSVMYML